MALSPSALAQDATDGNASLGVSADPELLFMRYGHDDVPGVSVPSTDVKNTLRVGLAMQYLRNPVVGYRLGQDIGAIVQNRINAQLGLSWDFAKWGALRLSIPVNINYGQSIQGFQAGGFGMGDIMLGATFLPYQSKHFNIGLRTDLHIPSGRKNAYMGGDVRGTAGVSMMGMVGPVDIIGDIGIVGRPVFNTHADFQPGPELVINEALRLRLPWVPLSFVQTLYARSGFTNFFGGGAESALELMGGVQVPLDNIGFNTNLKIDVLAGRGVNQGYGATDLRILAGVTFERNPGKKPKPEVIEITRPPPVPPPAYEEPEETEWQPEEVAREKEDRIEIRDPIEFFVNTSDIKPESLPIVRAVADIMNRQAKIKHLVIEGHASAEGEFDHNYELSRNRAESIFKQLIMYGVPADRMSYRAYGEVRPKVEGDTEEAYAKNRRVEFHIVAQYGEFDNFPDYGTSQLAPWNGERVKAVTPPTPAELAAQKQREERAKATEIQGTSFQEGREELHFDTTHPAPAPRPERAPDSLEGADFSGGDDDGFDFDTPQKPARASRGDKAEKSGQAAQPATDAPKPAGDTAEEATE